MHFQNYQQKYSTDIRRQKTDALSYDIEKAYKIIYQKIIPKYKRPYATLSGR